MKRRQPYGPFCAKVTVLFLNDSILHHVDKERHYTSINLTL